jgi:hypothetical protein
LVDTLDSKSGFFGSGGSSPPTGTTSQFQDVLKRSKTPVFKVFSLKHKSKTFGKYW